MTEPTHVEEVFAEVEPDPDAILETADAESPAELVAGGGRHDAAENSADAEASLADLLGNLKDAAEEATATTTSDREPTVDAITFGDPTVDVRPGDGAAIDALCDSESVATDGDLVGSATVTRVPTDAFGSS